MASDDNRGKSGSRVTETSKLNREIVANGSAGGSATNRQKVKVAVGPYGSIGATGAERARHPSIKSDLADQIGARLRSVYDDVLAQPVPERFLDLLRQLESGSETSLVRAKKDGT